MQLLKWSLLLAFSLASFGGTNANASTILFSNLVQPGDQYGPDGVGIGHTPSFPNRGDYLIYAVPFTPDATAILTSFEAPLGVHGGRNRLQAFLFSDAAGAPGNIIESLTLTGLPTTGFPFPLLSIASGLDPLVMGGQQYWFGVTGGGDTFGDWSLALPQGNGLLLGGAFRTVIHGVPQPWTVVPATRTGALAVFGTVVPEPSYMALLGCVLLLGARCIDKSRRR